MRFQLLITFKNQGNRKLQKKSGLKPQKKEESFFKIVYISGLKSIFQ